MGLLRRRETVASPDAAPQIANRFEIDLVRFDLLLQTSQKLRDAGVDYETIEQRASADSVSFNEALEAIYAERFRG
jgi:hypothetical protein